MEEWRKIEKENSILFANFEKERMDMDSQTAKNYQRRLLWEKREAGLDQSIILATDVAQINRNLIEEKEKMAAEMDSLHRAEFIAAKKRQMVRENSHELKLLEAQLRAAYVNKCVKAQIKEKELYQLEEKLREKRAQELMEKVYEDDKALMSKEEQIEKQKKHEIKNQLEYQISEKWKLKQEEFLEYMREKELLDDDVNQMKAEEIRSLEEKQEMQAKIKKEMETFHLAIKASKVQEKLAVEDEIKKLKEYQLKKEISERLKEEERKAKVKAEEALKKKISEEMVAVKTDTTERDNLLANLLLAEHEAKRKEEEERENIIDNRRKEECKADYFRVFEEKKRLKEEQKQSERNYAEQVQMKIEMELRNEKEIEMKRREQRISDRLYNERAMMQKKEKIEEEKKLLKLEKENDARMEEEYMAKIKKERIEVLREHAPGLVGYFPKGALKLTDLETLGIACCSPTPPSPTIPGVNQKYL